MPTLHSCHHPFLYAGCGINLDERSSVHILDYKMILKWPKIVLTVIARSNSPNRHYYCALSVWAHTERPLFGGVLVCQHAIRFHCKLFIIHYHSMAAMDAWATNTVSDLEGINHPSHLASVSSKTILCLRYFDSPPVLYTYLTKFQTGLKHHAHGISRETLPRTPKMAISHKLYSMLLGARHLLSSYFLSGIWHIGVHSIWALGRRELL